MRIKGEIVRNTMEQSGHVYAQSGYKSSNLHVIHPIAWDVSRIYGPMNIFMCVEY